MGKKYRSLLVVLFLICFALLLVRLTHGHTVAILQPRGTIGVQQRHILYFALGLSMLVIIPVYILALTIAWKYRATNTSARYTPDWDHDRRLETIWWAIPCAIILLLSVIAWRTSHSLDPYRPISSPAKTMTIQVVALDWKWLFIYPDENVATVNYVRFPVNTPVNFTITADAPMNSFWIPQLGSQIYAMAGMETHVNLMANEIGNYRGSSANVSGRGFAGMHFAAIASSQQDYDAWVRLTKHNPQALTRSSYTKLSQPSSNVPTNQYGSVDNRLYDTIVLKYMAPSQASLLRSAEQAKATKK